MKSISIAVFSFVHLALFGQTSSEQLKKLFLNLDIKETFHNVVKSSPLAFEYGVSRGVPLHDENGKIFYNEKFSYFANFDENPLIESKIKKGIISVGQQSQEVQSGHFSVHETVNFSSEEAMMKEYYKLTALFEEFAYRVKTFMILKENDDIKLEDTEIFIKTEAGKVTLHISYHFPDGWQEREEYQLVFVYSNY
jgi:hypothetical protein